MANAKAIPDGYHTITPSLVCRDAKKAMAFYKKAFGAEEIMCMEGPGGVVMHAEMQIGNSRIMMNDEMPAWKSRSPQDLGGTPVAFYVYLENVDASFKRAVDAGATAVMPPTDMFWGDRTSQVEDPFGHKWSLSQHVKDITPEEMDAGRKAFEENMKGKEGCPGSAA